MNIEFWYHIADTLFSLAVICITVCIVCFTIILIIALVFAIIDKYKK